MQAKKIQQRMIQILKILSWKKNQMKTILFQSCIKWLKTIKVKKQNNNNLYYKRMLTIIIMAMIMKMNKNRFLNS